jgi:hypothetical protein
MGCRPVIGALRLLGVWVLLGNWALAVTPGAQGAAEINLRVLDLAHPHFSQRIDNADSATFEFVRLTVARVDNPTHVGLIFGVAFVPDGGTRVQLGGFSLYPPDNPGSFIVSTRHLIKSPGVVVVTLHTATPVESGVRLSVTMGAIGLAHGNI